MEIKRPEPKQPTPPHAKKIFEGIIFDIYQWEQEMYDGTTATFERLKRPDTVGVIPVLPDGKIVIAEEEQPGKKTATTLLGGRVEEIEDPLEAVKRELLEESGYEGDSWNLLLAIQPVIKMDWAIYTFVARGCHKTREQHLDSGEKIKLKTVSFEEFTDLISNGTINDPDLRIKFLEAKLDPQKMAELKKIILD
ncbi:MAG: NUDIX hydrolase [Patescibacteria group bacterium]